MTYYRGGSEGSGREMLGYESRKCDQEFKKKRFDKSKRCLKTVGEKKSDLNKTTKIKTWQEYHVYNMN